MVATPMPVVPLPTFNNALVTIGQCFEPEIGVDMPFMHPVDSLTTLSLLLKLQHARGRDDLKISNSLLFEHPTPRSLALLISAPVCRR